MSRIGKMPIQLPAGVTVELNDNVCTVKGPKGELSQSINPNISVEVADGVISVTRPDDSKESRAQHGLYRALIHNMVVGVSTGFKKELEIVGVGYKAESKGQVLQLTLGFSHAIYLQLPPEVKDDFLNRIDNLFEKKAGLGDDVEKNMVWHEEYDSLKEEIKNWKGV